MLFNTEVTLFFSKKSHIKPALTPAPIDTRLSKTACPHGAEQVRW